MVCGFSVETMLVGLHLGPIPSPVIAVSGGIPIGLGFHGIFLLAAYIGFPSFEDSFKKTLPYLGPES